MTTLVRIAYTAALSMLKRLLARHPLVAYFGLAFALSWALILPMTRGRLGADPDRSGTTNEA